MAQWINLNRNYRSVGNASIFSIVRKTWAHVPTASGSYGSSLVPQTLWSRGAYRLEIISARSKRVWCNAYTFFVQRIAKSHDLLVGV